MNHLFGNEGLRALDELMRGSPLLAFDFDGTLAPIVARPEAARVSPDLARRLGELAQRLPLAIVTGRGVPDVQGRLGFVPSHIVGSHGAEDLSDTEALRERRVCLDSLRVRLHAAAGPLQHRGVRVEDKGLSVALHYRMARDRGAALAAIDQLLTPGDPVWRRFGGKFVVNVVSRDAPDKAASVRALVERTGADRAFFAGDDLNDEPVFEAAEPHWLTVRVGRDGPRSAAQFFIGSTAEMGALLDHMLGRLATRTAS